MPAAAQQETARLDLRPHYTRGDRWEGEAELLLLLEVRVAVPSADLNRTSWQEQRVLRRFRDELSEVEDGRVAEVHRHYLRDVLGARDPGEPTLRRSLGPLHQRRLVLRVDAEGRTRARTQEGSTSVSREAVADVVATERFEVVLPDAPVAVGERWEVDGRRVRRALGPGLGPSPTGTIACTLREVKLEALDDETPAERYALVDLVVEAGGRQSLAPDAPTLRAELRGTLRYSLRRRRVATVELTGTARLRQTRSEGDEVVELEGSGPMELRKRYWFPARPKKRRSR